MKENFRQFLDRLRQAGELVDLHQAVSEQDASRLTKIPGIGKKTAERLLLELRDKLDIGEIIAPSAQGAHGAGDIVNALLSLGYNEREAAWALKQLPAGSSVTDGIRQALKLLSKQ